MSDPPRDHEIEALAGVLRDRLVREASAGGAPDLPEVPPEVRIRALVDREAGILDQVTRDAVIECIARTAFGLGPLEPLLADPAVDEIMVTGRRPVWVERRGHLEPTDIAFASEAELRHVIERILAPLGRRVDEAEPMCDARLPDGARVNVVLPPLAVDGTTLTIRRFRRRVFTAGDLVACGTWSEEVRHLLETAVAARLNILVSGGTGSGKTTTLGVLSGVIPAGERIVTIEDTAELRLQQPHVVRLEARPPSVEGRGEVTIRRLVRNALRMRPDRIVVGEVRGAEALDMLAAMASGHDGALSTVHAAGAGEALRRLEVLALMADVGLPHAAIREHVADAIDLVVHQARMPDGTRRVVEVSEVVRQDDRAATRRVFALRGAQEWFTTPLDPRLASATGSEASS